MGVETTPFTRSFRATPAMHDDTIEPFWFPAVGRKKLTAGFDGGRLTLDGGVMLLAAAGRRIGIAQRLASLITGGLRLPMVSCRPAAEPPPAARWQSHKHGSARRTRSHWPATRLTIRGDGHYGRPEVMAWCEANDVDFIFGLPGNAVLSRLVENHRRRCPGAPRRSRGGDRAPLRRNPLWRQVLGLRAARGSTDRGHSTGVGHPIRGHHPARRQRRVAVRHIVIVRADRRWTII
jgi:hypothetical protein